MHARCLCNKKTMEARMAVRREPTREMQPAEWNEGRERTEAPSFPWQRQSVARHAVVCVRAFLQAKEKPSHRERLTWKHSFQQAYASAWPCSACTGPLLLQDCTRFVALKDTACSCGSTRHKRMEDITAPRLPAPLQVCIFRRRKLAQRRQAWRFPLRISTEFWQEPSGRTTDPPKLHPCRARFPSVHGGLFCLCGREFALAVPARWAQ